MQRQKGGAQVWWWTQCREDPVHVWGVGDFRLVYIYIYIVLCIYIYIHCINGQGTGCVTASSGLVCVLMDVKCCVSLWMQGRDSNLKKCGRELREGNMCEFQDTVQCEQPAFKALTRTILRSGLQEKWSSHSHPGRATQ